MTIRKALFILIGLVILAGFLFVVWKLGGEAIKKNQQATEAEQKAILAKEERAKAVALVQTVNGQDFDHFSTASWPKLILIKQLNLQTATSTEAVQSHGLAIIHLMKPLVISATLSPELLLKAYENNDTEALKQLDTLARDFTSATTNLLQLPVPPNAQVAHLRLVNSLQRYSFVLTNMDKVSQNPVWALEASQYHTQVFGELVTDLLFMNQYFVDQKIKISPNDQVPLYIPTTKWKSF